MKPTDLAHGLSVKMRFSVTAKRASNSPAFSLAQHRKIKFDLINKKGKRKKV